MFKFLLLFFFVTACTKKNAIDYSMLKPNLKFGTSSESLFSFKRPVEFSSKEGIERLKRATKNGTAVDFYNSVIFYAPQVYPVTCGPAALKIALSTLYAKEGLEHPISKETTLLIDPNGLHSPHFTFTERNLFDKVTEKDKKRGIEYDVIARQKAGPDGRYGGGISTADLALVANTFEPVRAEFYPISATEFSFEKYKQFKEKLIEVLKDPKQIIIINYFLALEIPRTGGHYALIVAFDPQTDSVLLLNPMAHYVEWSWVSLEDVYKSMSTVISGFDRGYLLVTIKNEFRKNENESKLKDEKGDSLKEDIKENVAKIQQASAAIKSQVNKSSGDSLILKDQKNKKDIEFSKAKSIDKTNKKNAKKNNKSGIKENKKQK